MIVVSSLPSFRARSVTTGEKAKTSKMKDGKANRDLVKSSLRGGPTMLGDPSPSSSCCWVGGAYVGGFGLV